MEFHIHDAESAPAESQKLLEGIENKFGFIPNLMGELAEAPAALKGYLKLDEIVGNSSLSAKEQQLAILAVSTENGCEYCTAVHSGVLKNQLGMDEDTLQAVRTGGSINDDKLNTLVSFTKTVVRERGHVSEGDIQNFLDAGYEQQNILEINLIVALKTLSNYTNHMAGTPLDEEFKPEEEKAYA